MTADQELSLYHDLETCRELSARVDLECESMTSSELLARLTLLILDLRDMQPSERLAK